MTRNDNDTASQLLELHVKHEMAALKGKKLRTLLAGEVDHLWETGESVTLGELSSVDQVMGVIRRIVMHMELGPAIPELAGDLSAAVLTAPTQEATRLGDILDREQVVGFVEQALELRHQRERLISEIISHPVYHELVSNLVYQGLVNYLYEDNLISKKIPGVSSAMKLGKRWANRAVPGLDESVEKSIKNWLNQSLPGLIRRSESFLHQALSDEELRDTVMAAWVEVEDSTIGQLRDGLGEEELQAFVVLGYEFWTRFRRTDYFEQCCLAVVTKLFEQYGDEPVTDLLTDIGVTRELIMAEVDALALPLVDLLRKQGYLEALVRRRLGSFYRSAAAKRLLE